MKCQKSKADRYSRQTMLVPMPIEEHPFGEIVMDFVGQLAESAGFNAIQVVADQFTKVQNYIAVKTTHIAEDVANSYMDNIWQLYVLLQH